MRIGLGQFGAALADVERNLERARSAVVAAADDGAELVCLPELCLSGYLLDRTAYTARLLDDVEAAQAALAGLGVPVVYGAPVRIAGGIANAVVLQAHDGTRLVYAKTHMDVKERRVFQRGDAFVVDERSGLGLACCYDLAFPEPCRVLALSGARALLAPMAWEVERGYVLDGVLAARAVENVAFVVGVNQAGTQGPFRFRGGSCVIDPLGHELTRLGAADETRVVDVDLGWVDRLRDRSDDATYPLLDDRRPDLYDAVSTSAAAPARSAR